MRKNQQQKKDRNAIEIMAIDDDVREEGNSQTNLCGSQRLLIAFMLGLCSFTFYAQRQSINMGIFCMVDHKAISNQSVANHNHTSECKTPLSSAVIDEDENDFTNGPFAWDKSTQSIILGSFFWGYLFQIFGGVFSAKLGPRNLLIIAVFVSSASTALIPLAAKFHYGLVIALRLCTGIAQGSMYPACLPLIAKWAPQQERGKLTSFLAAGSSLGTILATAITGPICKTGHWYANFLLLASIGFVWLILWLIYGANTPNESRHISTHELAYIQETAANTSDEKLKSIRTWPFKSILTSKSVLTIIATNILSDFTLYGIFSVFPLYLWEVFNVDVVMNSYISAGEYALMWVACIVAGILSDHFIRRKILSAVNTRRVFNSVGMFIPALLFPVIGFMPCDAYKIVILLLVLGGGFQGTFINAGYLLNAVDVAGSYSGIVIGISNSLGSFSGILAPLVASALTSERTMLQWRSCFIVFSSVLFLAGLLFVLFSKGDLEEWAKDDNTSNKRGKAASVVNRCEFDHTAATNIKRKPHSQLTRQYSLDSRGGLVPSSSTEESSSTSSSTENSYNAVVYVKPSNKTVHVQL